MRFRLRTLLIFLAVGPPLVAAGAWLVGFGGTSPVLLAVASFMVLVLLLVLASWLMESMDAPIPATDDESIAPTCMIQELAMRPDFTDEEQYLISYYKSSHDASLGELLGSEMTHLLAVVIMLGLAFYTESLVLAASASVVYAVLKVRESIHALRWRNATRSFIRKYESALAELNSKIANFSGEKAEQV